MGQHRASKKRAVREVLFRLSLQARPAEVVAALAASGISGGEGLVRAVVFELLHEKSRADVRQARARLPIIEPPVRRPARVPLGRGKRA